MRIVKLKGGLGNQMFQYAFAKLIEQKTHDEVKIDMSSYNNLSGDSIRVPRIMKFALSLPTASPEEIAHICRLSHTGYPLTFRYRAGIALENIINPKYYFERDRAYRNVDALLNNQYFDGYWQSWKYVDEVWDIVKREFVPNYEIDIKTTDLIQKMENENSVFIGIRRGDYQAAANHYGTYGQDYYDRALAIIEDTIKDPVYYIFSNDIAWVKSNIDFGERHIIYREPADIVDDFEELLLMMACKHAIILNSTYHWWGSRMNEYPGKIIVAPQKWFVDDKPVDIVPPHWRRT